VLEVIEQRAEYVFSARGFVITHADGVELRVVFSSCNAGT
jgi:hypothetical protein